MTYKIVQEATKEAPQDTPLRVWLHECPTGVQIMCSKTGDDDDEWVIGTLTYVGTLELAAYLSDDLGFELEGNNDYIKVERNEDEE